MENNNNVDISTIMVELVLKIIKHDETTYMLGDKIFKDDMLRKLLKEYIEKILDKEKDYSKKIDKEIFTIFIKGRIDKQNLINFIKEEASIALLHRNFYQYQYHEKYKTSESQNKALYYEKKYNILIAFYQSILSSIDMK